MSSSRQSLPAFENRLLASLPREEYDRLIPEMETVKLPQGRLLYEASGVIRHSYFLKGGMASILALTENGSAVEVGMVGNEGVVGLPAILRADIMPYRVIMQLPANAVRVRVSVLRAEFNRGGKFQDQTLRYANTLLSQLSQSAACNRFHTMEARLCRWLLVSRDRVHTDTINLTQEFLSHMIGAARPRVTTVAGKLQRAGLIRYNRGKIQIIDRAGLAASACECYNIVRQQIDHYLAA